MIVYGAGNLRQIKLITPCLHYGTGHASHSHMHRRFARALFRRRAGAGDVCNAVQWVTQKIGGDGG